MAWLLGSSLRGALAPAWAMLQLPLGLPARAEPCF